MQSLGLHLVAGPMLSRGLREGNGVKPLHHQVEPRFKNFKSLSSLNFDDTSILYYRKKINIHVEPKSVVHHLICTTLSKCLYLCTTSMF